MIHLKHKCKVNFVKLASIWIDLCLKLVFQNATAAAKQAPAATRFWTARQLLAAAGAQFKQRQLLAATGAQFMHELN
jgi:hypothetical protein